MTKELNELIGRHKDEKRELLKKLYDQCTEPQQQLFCRMYKSIEDIPEDKIDWAIQQCERTIEKNEEQS